MKRGIWHQFGDKSQRLVAEVLKAGDGVGVVLSPRDLSFTKAEEYVESYRDAGAEILADQQFYNPDFQNAHTASYPTDKYRLSVSKLAALNNKDSADLRIQLRSVNRTLKASAVLAPAVVCEAARPEFMSLNSRLFAPAREAANDLGVPTYATVILGHSVTTSTASIKKALADATKLSADGWYFGFEFSEDRIPTSEDAVYRFCEAALELACTGKPVLHAYAGPMAVLSLGAGSTGTAIGHSQITWQFNRERWQKEAKQGGGGDTPARFFSAELWGTIVYPDEIAALPARLKNSIITQSRYSNSVRSNLKLDKWEANKHLVTAISNVVKKIAETDNARASANAAIYILKEAERLHGEIAKLGIQLKDRTSSYQRNWRRALENLLAKHTSDFDYLQLLGNQ
jgi:hypothetical protein